MKNDYIIINLIQMSILFDGLNKFTSFKNVLFVIISVVSVRNALKSYIYYNLI